MTKAVDYTAFCRSAEEYLRSRAPEVAQEVVHAGFPAGRWHPYGFAVFKLANAGELGTMRLHIWSAGKRIAWPNHPPVHEHEWHIAGLVLAGTYIDEEFDASVGAGPDALPVVEIDSVEGRDVFRPTAQLLRLETDGRRAYRPGEIHFVRAGAYHASPIPEGTFAATLALTSTPAQLRRSIAGLPVAGQREYSRPLVSDEDAARLRNEFSEHYRRDR